MDNKNQTLLFVGKTVSGFFVACAEGAALTLSENKRDIVVCEYNKKRIMIDEHYQSFIDNHESYLGEIQEYINSINIRKNKIKLGLEKLCNILAVKTNKYELDYLDYREFIVNEDYDIIKKEKCTIEKECPKMKCFRRGDTIVQTFKNVTKIVNLQNKIKKLEQSCNFIYPKMKADLQKLSDLADILKTISFVFCTICEELLPLFEKHVDDLLEQYGGNVDDLPDEKGMFLHTTKDLLKNMAEKSIICHRNHRNIKDTIKYVNEITNDYNKIQEQCIKNGIMIRNII